MFEFSDHHEFQDAINDYDQRIRADLQEKADDLVFHFEPQQVSLTEKR